jgi:hypothetical protein
MVQRPHRADVLILSTGSGLAIVGGESVNSLADPFAEALGQRAWSVEGLFEDHWPRARRRNRRVSSSGLDRLRIAVQPRLVRHTTQRRPVEAVVNLAAERARTLLGWRLSEDRREALIGYGARRVDQFDVQRSIAASWIRRVRPTIALIEEASYGQSAVTVALLREHGVRTVEFQHGMVTPGHDAYNVAPALAASNAFQRLIPDTFLSYGERWSRQFNMPIRERVVIGNPRRTAALQNWRPAADRSRIIVLGDGIETDAFIALTARLARVLGPGWDVRFRPHPIERSRLRPDLDVTVDEQPLYESFAHAHCVVGEASTALFEAIGLVPRIVAWDTPKSRFYLGLDGVARAATVEQIADIVATSQPRSQPSAEEWWANEWLARFHAFIDPLID